MSKSVMSFLNSILYFMTNFSDLTLLYAANHSLIHGTQVKSTINNIFIIFTMLIKSLIKDTYNKQSEFEVSHHLLKGASSSRG